MSERTVTAKEIADVARRHPFATNVAFIRDGRVVEVMGPDEFEERMAGAEFVDLLGRSPYVTHDDWEVLE